MVNTFNYPPGLPINEHRAELIELIQQHQVIIVAGETGSGKTTQLPKMCLEAGQGKELSIACTQPRRIAASSVSKRVAEELGSEGGRLVGYKVRFHDRTQKTNRIRFMTDGILLAEASSDLLLKRYDTIIIDEAHERSLNIDFLLGLLPKLIKQRRDLKVIISSATLDTKKFSAHFDKAPVVQIPGKTYPVEVRYQVSEARPGEEQTPAEQVNEAVRLILRQEPPGDILVFMPTERDITEAVELLDKLAPAGRTDSGSKRLQAVILPLFGRMASAEQARIFSPQRQRKIVIATNVAETSITVPGIRYVIDTGLARIASYNPRARTTKMPVVPISAASAEQRKGRCGRVGPGVCIRLYSEEEFLAKEPYTPPEIVRSNLAEVIMRMYDLRLGHPKQFPFIDPPSPRAIKDGFQLLQELGAVKGDQRKNTFSLTSRGRVMAKLPLDPTISRMILEARERQVLQPVMVITAVLSIQDPRVRPSGLEKQADSAHQKFTDPASDFLSYLKIWQLYHHTAAKVKSQAKLRKFCQQNFLAYQRMREWCDIYQQICRFLGEQATFEIAEQPPASEAIHQAILSGLLRNIGLKKTKNIYQGTQAKELMIFPGSGQFNQAGQWIMAAELVETTRLYGRTVATINPQWLESLAGALCSYAYAEPHWEKKRGQVIALQKITLFGLLIANQRRVNFGPIDPGAARKIFIQAALVEGEVTGQFNFLTKNRELIASLQDFEDRLRQRKVVDEYRVFEFYDRQLPAQVWDIATLRGKLPLLAERLLMTEADIVSQSPDFAQLVNFPNKITVNGFELPVSYKFEPGHSEDGITVHIPVAALPHLSPQFSEWLVPGLFTEKVCCLLKGLPKAKRKKLVPINRTAEQIAQKIQFGAGSLYASLAEFLERCYKLVVEKEDWSQQTLPRHLQMRFCLMEPLGQCLKESRSFAELFDVTTKPGSQDQLAQLKKAWERENYEFEPAPVPEKIELLDEAGRLTGYLFPTLVDQGQGQVALKLSQSEQRSRELGKLGLLALYLHKLPKQLVKSVQKVAFRQLDWPLYEWIGSMAQVNEEVRLFILQNSLPSAGEIPGYEEFCRQLESLQDSLYEKAVQDFQLIDHALVERQKVMAAINHFESLVPRSADNQKRFDSYRRHLIEVLPPTFLQRFTVQRLSHSVRHLAALKIRVERAHAAPRKDSDKLLLILPFSEKLTELSSLVAGIKIPSQHHELQDRLNEFAFMLEEYKVSVFAPELKTAMPVSKKKLAAGLAEINRLMAL